jgi:hypothetical protein
VTSTDVSTNLASHLACNYFPDKEIQIKHKGAIEQLQDFKVVKYRSCYKLIVKLQSAWLPPELLGGCIGKPQIVLEHAARNPTSKPRLAITGTSTSTYMQASGY